MKEILYFFGIVVAAAMGYKFEPQLRSTLAAEPPATEIIENAVATDASGTKTTAATPAMDLANLAAGQLPEKVLLKTDAKVSDASSGIVMSIAAGNHVKLVRIEGETIIISPGPGPFVGKVAIADTDLLAQLTAKPPAAAVPAAATPVAPIPVPEPATPVAPAAPVTPAAGNSQEPPAAVAPAPATEPTPPPATEPAPAPAPEPTPAVETPPLPQAPPAPAPEIPATPASGTPNSAAIVKAIQDSIRSGQIKEFKFDQVLKWEAGPDETVDGEVYHTGLASYKAETIFGVKTIQAKALLKAGKAPRWIWPKSGMEIK